MFVLGVSLCIHAFNSILFVRENLPTQADSYFDLPVPKASSSHPSNHSGEKLIFIHSVHSHSTGVHFADEILRYRTREISAVNVERFHVTAGEVPFAA